MLLGESWLTTCGRDSMAFHEEGGVDMLSQSCRVARDRKSLMCRLLALWHDDDCI